MSIGELAFGATLAVAALRLLEGHEQGIILAIVAAGLLIGFLVPRRR